MNLHAGFLKRSFAFIVDLTLVIVLTYLLWLFPFQMIANKSIDKNYKENIKEPYEKISEKYSGSTSLLGSAVAGEYSLLKEYIDQGYMSVEIHGSYVDKIDKMYNVALDIASSLNDNKDIPYNSEDDYEDQFYSSVYELYTYLDNSYTVTVNFPFDREQNKHLVDLKAAGKILDSELTTLTAEYKENAKKEYAEQLEILIQLLKYYDSKNESFDVTKTIVYSTITNKFLSNSSSKVANIESEFDLEDQNKVVEYVKAYHKYEKYVTSTEYLTTEVKDGETVVLCDKTIDNNNEVYYIFYYALANSQFKENLPYYVQVYNQTNYSIIYALVMFTVIFSIYTALLRGNTLGRRAVKVQLTDGHDREKLNPVKALLHDVPFRFLYILALGLFSLLFALVALVVFTIADIIMIRFTKGHKCIRDILSGTKVIEGSFHR